MSVREHLQRIYDDNGAITPQLVVDTAKQGNHPLHPHFEWDDSVAGDLYRCNQAAQMIRRVTIRLSKPDGEEVVTRAWVSRTEIEGRSQEVAPTGHYLPVEIVTSSPDLRPKYEQAMEREWKTLYAKYKDYKQFIQMVTADIESVA